MKIVELKTTIVRVPLPKSIGTAIHAISSVGLVLVEAKTDDGIVGESHIFTINADRIRAFDETIKGLASFVEGQDPHDTGRIWSNIWSEINPTGHKGITVSALSAIDIACWDAVGHAAALPLHKMFGACRETVPTYASSGLWLSYSIDELVTEAQSFVEAGFKAIKMRVGSDDLLDDVERVRVVRETVGPDIGLLVDANQKFTPKQAIRLGRMLEPFALTWFEEPVVTHDLAGHARVRDALDVPIASGETEYTKFGMAAMIDAGAADILMPDLQRIGGFTEFRKASALAEANNLAISSHFFTEASLCMAGSLANCNLVEHVDWFAPIFAETMELLNGELVIPARPGHGFRFDPEAVAHYRLA